jgi:predicted metal-dependent hydrolase
MPVLRVGKIEIPYRVRHSERARRMRIVVSPGKVEVVAPDGTEQAVIAAFIESKRKWVFNKHQEIKVQAATLQSQGPSRYVSGAKILYRGRQMPLSVSRDGERSVGISYRNGFHVTAPSGLDAENQDQQILKALKVWFLDRLRRDVNGYVDDFAKKLGVRPVRVRLKEQKHLWGSCGHDKIINLNWHLIFAPKPVLQYAVLHEMCHLLERNHSPRFWELVAGQMPDYEEKKLWLTRNRAVADSFSQN